MRYISLVLITSILCCYAAETNDSASQATALKVASIMKKNNDAVTIANNIALKELKKLLLANKKNKNDCVLIALKINKLDKNDKEAIELIKDIPIESQDLLGEQGDSDKYISEVKAKLIAEALAKNKFTGKEWDALPGLVLTIEANKPPVNLLNMVPSKRIFIPNPDDSWKAMPERQKVDYKGDGVYMILKVFCIEETDDPIEVKLSSTPFVQNKKKAQFKIGHYGGAPNPSGSIRVKIYEVVSLE